MPNEEPPAQDGKVTLNPVLKNFITAQFANLFKFALWWTSLAPLMYTMTGDDASIIGVARIVYNTALCVLSPFGAILVGKVHPKKILATACFVRFVLYVILLPTVWILFDTKYAGAESPAAVYACLCVMMFIDGCAVAMSTVLDLDMGGLDIVSGVFGFPVTDDMRNFVNSLQELFFSICFILLSPGMAFVGLATNRAFAKYIDAGHLTSDQAESGTLVSIFMIAFFVASVVGWVFIARMKDPNVSVEETDDAEKALLGNEQQRKEQGGINAASSEASLDTHHSVTAGGAGESSPSGGEVATAGGEGEGEGGNPIVEALIGLKVAFLITVKNTHLLFRLVFLGFEIAFEDAAIVVIAAQMGIRCPWLGNGDGVRGNIWTAVAVAAGKLGGAVASIAMMKLYHPPENPKGYMMLFIFTTVSTIITCGFPIITMAQADGDLTEIGAEGLYLTLFFLYFFFSTLPKLGFMSMLQSLVSSIENGPTVFGFIAIIAMSMDALIIMGLSAFFIASGDAPKDIAKALWYVAYCYMAHGVLELILGPLLILRPMQKIYEAEEEKAALDKERAAREEEEETSRKLVMSTPAQRKPSNLGDGATAAQYTQRSAAVPLGVARADNTVDTAIISMSHPTPMVYATRRKSGALQGVEDETTGLVGSRPKVGSAYTRPGALFGQR